MSLAVKCTLSI